MYPASVVLAPRSLALILYPILWLLLLPFRLAGIVITGVLEFFRALIFLPARILRGPRGV